MAIIQTSPRESFGKPTSRMIAYVVALRSPADQRTGASVVAERLQTKRAVERQKRSPANCAVSAQSRSSSAG
jgi:hypothetical protein